jgi:hypothetical protein
MVLTEYIEDLVSGKDHRPLPRNQERGRPEFEIFADRGDLSEYVMADNNIAWQLHPSGLVKNFYFE